MGWEYRQDAAPTTYQGNSRTFFLASDRVGSVIGTGTVGDPYNVNTRSSFDSVASSLPANAVVRYYPGTFLSKGFIPKSGQRHYLTDETTIKLDVLTTAEATALNNGGIAIMGGNTASQTLLQDVTIEGGIWDCNLAAQTRPLRPSAIYLHCDGLKVKNAKFIGWGSTIASGEAFVVGASSDGAADLKIFKRPSVYDGLEFCEPASVTNLFSTSLLNPSAVANVQTSATLSNGWFEGVSVNNCTFRDITTTDNVDIACINMGGWMKGFTATGNKFINITGQNARYGFYIDTGALQDVLIHDNQFINCNTAISHINGDNLYRSGIVVRENFFNGCTYAGINWGENTHASNFHADNNMMVAVGSYGIYCDKVVGVRYTNNIIDKASDQITTASAPTIWAAYGNRTLAGIAIDTKDVWVPNLPTTNPAIAGRAWANSGVVTISSG